MCHYYYLQSFIYGIIQVDNTLLFTPVSSLSMYYWWWGEFSCIIISVSFRLCYATLLV